MTPTSCPWSLSAAWIQIVSHNTNSYLFCTGFISRTTEFWWVSFFLPQLWPLTSCRTTTLRWDNWLNMFVFCKCIRFSFLKLLLLLCLVSTGRHIRNGNMFSVQQMNRDEVSFWHLYMISVFVFTEYVRNSLCQYKVVSDLKQYISKVWIMEIELNSV